MFSNGTEEAWASLVSALRMDEQIKITVETVKERNMEVLQQRRYYRGVIVRILADFMGYNGDEMHHLLASKFLSYEKRGRSGKVQTFIRSTADGEIDTLQFTEFIDKCLALGDQLQLRIPTPEEIEKNPQILKDLYPNIFGKNLERRATLEDLQKIFNISKHNGES